MKLHRAVALLYISLIASICTMASPAFRQKKTVCQPDGTLLTIVKTGGEHLIYYITTDGIPVTQNTDSAFYYAADDGTGNLKATSRLAHNKQQRDTNETNEAEKLKQQWHDALQRGENLRLRYGIGARSTASVTPTGAPRIPVILVNFQDKSFGQDGYLDSSTDANTFFNHHFNDEQYTEYGNAGSVRDYFTDQSNGLFKPVFDIYGPVTLSHASAYYGTNSGGIDKRADAMMAEAACLLIAAGADLSAYCDASGNIPFAAFIYAGDGEHATGDNDDVAARYYPYLKVKCGTYTLQTGLCTNEVANYDGQGLQPDGIGTFCHELSHAMGLPDFYNTNGLDNIFGLDAWDIMDYGQYVENAHRPVGYSAYEREYMGWMKTDTLSTQQRQVVIPPLPGQEGEEAHAYKILNNADPTGNEYYILENRQPSKWYSEDYGSGMLVYHIDYSLAAWTANSVNNNRTHQRITIIPADGILTPAYLSADNRTYQGDPYPGITGNRELSNSSQPCDTAYTGKYMNCLISNISTDANGNITFAYMTRDTTVTAVNTTKNSITPQRVYTPDGFYLGNKIPQNQHRNIYIICEGEKKKKIYIP